MLLAKRFDAALGVRLSFLGTIRRLGLARDQFDPLLVLRRREMLAHYSLKHYDPLMAARLEKALAALRSSGVMATLYKPYDGGGLSK
jgi:hypothetical protein